jgi:hypothetical protein
MSVKRKVTVPDGRSSMLGTMTALGLCFQGIVACVAEVGTMLRERSSPAGAERWRTSSLRSTEHYRLVLRWTDADRGVG